MALIDQAISFAALAHEGQKRKYNGLPYITHPIHVMTIVHPLAFTTNDMRIAALLHDVLEDTDVAHEEIVRRFGLGVYELVMELTKVHVPGNRFARKAAERDRLSQVSAEAQTIKLADILSNTETVAQDDEDFANLYLEEQRQLVNLLRRGSNELQFRARDQIARGQKYLEAKVCRI